MSHQSRPVSRRTLRIAPSPAPDLAKESRFGLPRDVQLFDALPDTALVDVKTVAHVVQAGVSTVWRWVQRDPAFPKPMRLTQGTTRWMVGELRVWLRQCAADRYIVGTAATPTDALCNPVRKGAQ